MSAQMKNWLQPAARQDDTGQSDAAAAPQYSGAAQQQEEEVGHEGMRVRSHPLRTPSCTRVRTPLCTQRSARGALS